MVLGVPVDCDPMHEVLAKIDQIISKRDPSILATADASMIVAAHETPPLMNLLQRAEIVTPDSVGVLWALKRQGKKNVHRVSGVDLVDCLCARSADRGYRIVLLGAEPGVAEKAAERLRLKHPGCNIVGTRHGYFPAESDSIVAHEVAEMRPDILLVAMGIPRQEVFIQETQPIIKAPIAIGVGGSFDVFSGKVKRAPKFIQKLKFEWLWRLGQNPKKIGKVMTLPRFVMMVLRQNR